MPMKRNIRMLWNTRWKVQRMNQDSNHKWKRLKASIRTTSNLEYLILKMCFLLTCTSFSVEINCKILIFDIFWFYNDFFGIINFMMQKYGHIYYFVLIFFQNSLFLFIRLWNRINNRDSFKNMVIFPPASMINNLNPQCEIFICIFQALVALTLILKELG